MFFKVLGGNYVDEHKVKHEKGAVVESSKPLNIMFPNSFQPVNELQAAAERGAAELQPAAVPAVAAESTPPAAPVKAKQPPKEEEAVDETVDSELGDDVTEDYPKAREAGLLVFQKGTSFHIAAKGDPNKSLKKLKQKGVKSYIENALSDDD